MYVQSHVIRCSVHKKQAVSQLAVLVINVMCPDHYLNTNTTKFLFVRGGEGEGEEGEEWHERARTILCDV